MTAALALLVLCFVWHRLRCRKCARQECRDLERTREAIREALRTLQARKAAR